MLNAHYKHELTFSVDFQGQKGVRIIHDYTNAHHATILTVTYYILFVINKIDISHDLPITITNHIFFYYPNDVLANLHGDPIYG